MRVLIILGMMVVGTAAATPRSLPPSDKIPPQLASLLDCQRLTDSSARLACFDQSASTVAQSIGRRDLIVVDREMVRSTRRSLFGFTVPTLGLFGSDTDEVRQIDGLLAYSSRNRDGGYVLGLKDGSEWSQIDDRPLALEPRANDKITIHSAAMGSFMLNVGRMPGLRVRRIK